MVDRGTVFDDLSDRPLVTAPHRTGPVVLEPVMATIELKRQGRCRVFALDHGGRKADPPREVPVERAPDGWRLVLDGAAYKTHYYVAEFEAS